MTALRKYACTLHGGKDAGRVFIVYARDLGDATRLVDLFADREELDCEDIKVRRDK